MSDGSVGPVIGSNGSGTGSTTYSQSKVNGNDQSVGATSDGGLRRRHHRRRSLHWQQELLDGFRRGWQRGDCANEVGAGSGLIIISIDCCILSSPFSHDLVKVFLP